MRRVGGPVICLAFIIIVCGACRPPHGSRSSNLMLEVDLDAFSGVPNPHWNLSESQSSEFLARFKSLKPATGKITRNEGLGYRGFIITSHGDVSHELSEARVYRGQVFVQRADREEILSDPEFSLESWLLNTASGHVPESILEMVRREISNRR